MQIIKATPEDFELIAPIFDKYRQFYHYSSDVEAAKQYLKERLSHNESIIFYVHNENKILGFMQMYPSFSSLAMNRMWILYDLFVEPESRRQSVGRKLLEKAIQFAQMQNARGLCLKTSIDNLPAQKLYEAMGWEKDNQFYSYNYLFK